MTVPLFTIATQPSSELMLALDAIVGAFNRLADVIEASNQIGRAVPVLGPTQPIEAPTLPVKAPIAPLAPMPPTAQDPAWLTQPSAPKGSVFTPERNEIIRRGWPIGTPVREILAAVNALPGREVTVERLRIQAAGSLGLKRPPSSALGSVSATAPAAPAAPPAGRMDIIRQVAASVQARPPATPTERSAPIPREPIPDTIKMDAMGLLRWAGQRGISLQLPIDERAVERVNDKARSIGHPPIEYAPSFQRARP